MKSTLALFIAIGISGFSVSSYAAGYTGSAYESFDYTSGTGITVANALNGGVGWNALGDGSANTVAWGVTVPNNNSGNGITVGTGSLSYPGVTAAGQRAVLNGSTTTAIGRLFGQSIDSGTFYFSFLMQKTVDTERTLNVSFFSSATGTGTPNERFAIGQIGGGANDSDGNFAVLVSNSGTDNGIKLATSPLSLGLNTTHLVVGKIDFNVSGVTDLLTIYIDPSLASEPGSSYMTTSTDFQFLMGFRMFAGAAAAPFTPAAQGDFDDHRFGTTWDSVTSQMPEPSSLAILLCGGAAFLGYQRRNRRSK